MAVLRASGDPLDPVAAEKAALALNPALATQLGEDAAFAYGRGGPVAASKVASISQVRAALLKFQRNFCDLPPNGKRGAVLDGRDIGTVIAPDAKVKIFITASPEIRAERRVKELQGRGQNAIYAIVLADMQERDARDAERAIAPTKPASDAVLLDTTDMTAAQAFAEAVKIAASRI